MTFEDLLGQVDKVARQEIRAKEKDYMEIVVTKANLAAVNTTLTGYFGPPLKPEGAETTSQAAQYAKPHGGVMKNQTLYFAQKEKIIEAALLWPWGSGASITVKVFRANA
jgi:hypothetical protein